MKYGGEVIEGPYFAYLVIPKGDRKFVLKLQAVTDYTEFDKLCPMPNPPSVLKRGETQPFQDDKDPAYLKALDEWATKRVDWMVIKALEVTTELEFETINMSDSTTWKNYQDELRKAGFSNLELAAIINKVTELCGLDQRKIDEATEAFLADLAAQQK